MAPPIKKIIDRPTVQTEKCLGYDMVRKCKASSFLMGLFDNVLPVQNGRNLFQQFVDLGHNYKGDTNFKTNMLEDFNSFRIKSSGTIYLDAGVFNLWFQLYDLATFNVIGNAKSNYGDDHSLSNNNVQTDWFLDVEVTYYRKEGLNNLIVNGSFTHSNDHHNEKKDLSLVPIMGQIENFYHTDVFFDFTVLGTDSCFVKDFSVDFIE